MTADGTTPRETAEHRERLRRGWAIAIRTLTLFAVIAAFIFLQGSPAQLNIMLSIVALGFAALYTLEVWARTGRVRLFFA